MAQINQRPGIHLRKLQRNLECSSNTINYHIGDLDVREKKIHGYRRLYPSDIPEYMEKPLAALNHKVRGLILYQINSGSSHSEIAESLEVSKSTVSEHLNILEQDNLINKEMKGRSSEFSLTRNSLEAFRKYASCLLDVSTERFIQMWE